jgi:hypothetical protein
VIILFSCQSVSPFVVAVSFVPLFSPPCILSLCHGSCATSCLDLALSVKAEISCCFVAARDYQCIHCLRDLWGLVAHCRRSKGLMWRTKWENVLLWEEMKFSQETWHLNIGPEEERWISVCSVSGCSHLFNTKKTCCLLFIETVSHTTRFHVFKLVCLKV